MQLKKKGKIALKILSQKGMEKREVYLVVMSQCMVYEQKHKRPLLDDMITDMILRHRL